MLRFLVSITVLFVFIRQLAQILSQILKSAALKRTSQKNFRRAVKRNLLKRRMREAYRLRKQLFMQDLPEGESLIHMGFVYSSNELADFACLQNEIKSLLMQLATRIKKN